MATTGATFPTSGTTVDRSAGTAWNTPGNITADDTSYAVQAAAGVTDYLIASGYGFSIPAGSTIDGVTVVVSASETGTNSGAYTVRLISATTPTLIGTAKGPTTVTGTTQVASTNGGAADLWGATLTPAIVNDAGFGVALYSDDSVNVHSIDYITVEITYTPPKLNLAQSGSTSITGTVTPTGDLGISSATSYTLYGVLYAAAQGAPSVAQVKAGQDNTSGAALWSANITAPGSTGTYDWPTGVTGLTPGASYRHALVLSDGATDSPVSVSDAWQTTGATLNLAASPVALTGTVSTTGTLAYYVPKLALVASPLAISGTISTTGQIAYRRPFNVTASPLALTGTLTTSGNLGISTAIKLDLNGQPIALAGTATVAGNFDAFVVPTLNLSASPLAVTGTVSTTGALTITKRFNLAASPISLTGTAAVAGSIGIGTSFNLACQPIVVAGVVATTGDLGITDAPLPTVYTALSRQRVGRTPEVAPDRRIGRAVLLGGTPRVGSSRQ